MLMHDLYLPIIKTRYKFVEYVENVLLIHFAQSFSVYGVDIITDKHAYVDVYCQFSSNSALDRIYAENSVQ